MHESLLDEIIANVRRREAAGDCPPKLLFSPEQLENAILALAAELERPVPMLLWCPECQTRHVDEGEFATKPHETHACQNCGMVWKPSKWPTVGVRHLEGCKNP